MSGRGALNCRMKVYPRGALDDIQVIMPELVAKNRVRNPVA